MCSSDLGLSGIPAVRGKIARPFLWLTREDLERYAAARSLPHVEDETNADPEAAARNLLRQKVMPVLRELNPRAAQNMGRTAAIIGQENALLEQQAKALAGEARMEEGVLRIPQRTLTEAPPAVAVPAVLELLEAVCGKRRNLTAVDGQTVLALCRREREKWELRLPHSLLVRGEGEELIVALLPAPPEPAVIGPGRAVSFGEWEVTLSLEPGPGDSYPIVLPREGPLMVTAWRSGDRMTLPGARGSRTVKRLCADAGFLPWQRDTLPVLRAGEEPIAVPQVGVAAGFVPETEGKTLYVTFCYGQHA